jgi:hypothetical protein
LWIAGSKLYVDRVVDEKQRGPNHNLYNFKGCLGRFALGKFIHAEFQHEVIVKPVLRDPLLTGRFPSRLP